MRIRTIKPEFFKHDELAKLPPLARILFVGLWGMADCAGRLEDRPARIKVEVLPYDDFDVEAALKQLAEAEFIVRYHKDGLSLIQVATFSKHQRITGKEADATSRFPPPEEVKAKRKRETPGKSPSVSPTPTGEAPETTGNGRETEGKGREGKEGAPAPDGAAAPASPDPAALDVPLLLNTPAFRDVWARWVTIRKKSRSRPKTPWPEFFAEQLKWLEKLGTVEDAIESVSQSIRNGWQGLFPPKNNGPRRPGHGQTDYGGDGGWSDPKAPKPTQ